MKGEDFARRLAKRGDFFIFVYEEQVEYDQSRDHVWAHHFGLRILRIKTKKSSAKHRDFKTESGAGGESWLFLTFDRVSLLQKFFPEIPEHSAVNNTARAGQFLLVAAQAGMLFALLWLYAVERGTGLHIVLPWLFGAFLVHYWLPSRFRDAFFVLVTWTAILYALGPFSGSVLIAGVLGMIGICHLPVKYGWRVLLLVLAGAALVALRLQIFYVPRVLVAVPLIGMMLMFRLVIYMYELRFEKTPPSPWQRLSYFFLLPNICFPLFPIIDYKTFLRNRFNAPHFDVYQRALRRILLGFVHLLVYRTIYYHVVPSPASLEGLGDLVVYLVSNYSLVLRLTGTFWIAIGMLGLFGWNMPPIFDNIFLVSGFSDIWRRINIYWKDFVMKVFYYPIYFRLRKKVKRNLVLLTTVIVFLITWQLHSWQWFWVRGDFPFTAMDALYWMMIGFFIALNLVWEEKRGQVKRVREWTFANSLSLVLRITGMYVFMSVLWALWSSTSVNEWLYLLTHFGRTNAKELLLVLAGLAALLALGMAAHFIIIRKGWRNGIVPSAKRSAALVLVSGALLCLPLFKTNSEAWNKFSISLRSDRMNEYDREKNEQGYYEKLLDKDAFDSRSPWDVPIKTRQRETWFKEAETASDNLLLRKLKPNVTLRSPKGQTFSTNSFGMRDKEYALKKDPLTLRIALLGSSYEMGSGVSDDEVFEALVEKWLNDSLQKAGSPARVEILNFGVGAYHVFQHAWLSDSVIYAFEPDIVMYVAHSHELRRMSGVLARMIQNGVDLHYPEIKSASEKAGVKQSMSRNEILNRFRPYRPQLLAWGYRYIAERAQEHGAVPAWIYLPTVGEEPPKNELSKLNSVTRFGWTIFSLEGVYGNVPQESLQISRSDNHPNAEGHRLIAKKLYERLWDTHFLDPYLNAKTVRPL